MVPHPKEGDHKVANNNRPAVSLLPVLSKVVERIAMRQFNDYLTLHNRLTRHQSGNRTLHSTETLSLLVIDDIFRAMDSRQITAMVLTDLTVSAILPYSPNSSCLAPQKRYSSGSRATCQTDSSVLELEHHCRIPSRR